MNDEGEILVSCCFPTRKRVDKLRKCVESVYSTATNPKGIEFVMRVDDDDAETLEGLNGIVEYIASVGGHLKVLSGPKGNDRFERMFVRMFHECCEVARGRWIWQMENDCGVRPESQGWDYRLADIPIQNTICTPSVNYWNSHVVSWDKTFEQMGCGPWHTGHFILMPNRWWEQFALTTLGAPMDQFTLNFLCGKGLGGNPPGNGWQLVPLPGLSVWHGQEKDEVFLERGRKSYT